MKVVTVECAYRTERIYRELGYRKLKLEVVEGLRALLKVLRPGGFIRRYKGIEIGKKRSGLIRGNARGQEYGLKDVAG